MFKNLVRTGNTDPYLFAIYIGLFAGLLGSVIRAVAYELHFTQYDTSFLISTWFVRLEQSQLGVYVFGGLSFIAFSIATSVLYMLLLRKKQGAFWGIGYGIVWWGIVYFLFPLVLNWPTTSIVSDIDTIIFECCFMVVWGVFIGYSIAFEFTDEASYEPIYAK